MRRTTALRTLFACLTTALFLAPFAVADPELPCATTLACATADALQSGAQNNDYVWGPLRIQGEGRHWAISAATGTVITTLGGATGSCNITITGGYCDSQTPILEYATYMPGHEWCAVAQTVPVLGLSDIGYDCVTT